MIGVDVRDHRHERLQVQERGIAFVGLGHQILAASEARVGAGANEAPADDKGRVEAALRQHTGREAGGGGLAVRAGNGDAVLQSHQLGQHFGARDHRDLGGARRLHLGVRVLHRRRNHHHVRAGDVRRVMADGHADTKTGEAFGVGVLGAVRTGHTEFEVVQHLGDAAHADTADTDEVCTFHPVTHAPPPGKIAPRSRSHRCSRRRAPPRPCAPATHDWRQGL